MPVFTKRDSHQYLITNFKVMYSTLKHQKNLHKIRIDKALKYDILSNWFFLGTSEFYFISRNPYHRIESFFKEKFRKSLNYYDENGFWQDSQILFFPYLGINDSMDNVVIKNKLKTTSFNEIVSLLPKVYMRDNHLKPQWIKKVITIKRWGIKFNVPIKIKKLIKIESKEDLQELNSIFNIDITSKTNSTSSINEKLVWTETEFRTIELLYDKDFKFFKYKKMKK